MSVGIDVSTDHSDVAVQSDAQRMEQAQFANTLEGWRKLHHDVQKRAGKGAAPPGLTNRVACCWLAMPGMETRLHTLADYPTRTDLDVEVLVNLERGSSSLRLIVVGRDTANMIDSLYPVPSLLAVHPASAAACSGGERDEMAHPGA